MRRYLFLLVVALAASCLAVIGLPATSARAATLAPVPNFGPNPGNMGMYAYVPDGLPADRPAVVLLHGCTQNAEQYFMGSGWRTLADRWGFALLLPEQRTANNANRCLNWFEAGDIARGQGEAASIRQMVTHAVSAYGTDPGRVFVSGLSAGGAMTSVMLATYPDAFAGGSVIAGIPYRCGVGLANAFPCLNLGVDRTPAQWGDLVRDAHPGHAGARPIVAVWQGTADTTVHPMNATELRDQWTNVLGVSTTPTSTASLPAGTTLETYGDDQVRVYRIQGMGHGTPVDPGTGPDQCGVASQYFLDTVCAARYEAEFFGIDDGTPPPTQPPIQPPTDPPATECVTDDNYAHVQAGRAYHELGNVYARGSDDPMGLYNTYATTTLRQTGPESWAVGC